MSWSEDEIKKLDEIYNNSNSLKEFLNKAQGIKGNSTLIRFYYDRKKGLNAIKPKNLLEKDFIENKDKSFDVKVLNQNEVKVEDKNVEADKGLKDIYKRMSNDLFGEDESLLEKGFTENEEKKEGEENIEEIPKEEVKSQPQLNLSNPLATLAIAINDHLLYGDKGLIGYRPLESDEKEVINESSKGVIAELEYIEDPKMRYLFYSYLVPAVARIDLYIDKLASVIRNRSLLRKGFSEKNVNQNQGSLIDVSSKEKSNLTEQQRQMLENWRNGGFKVDPAFDFNKDIDIMAYRDLKIVRNIGSNFM